MTHTKSFACLVLAYCFAAHFAIARPGSSAGKPGSIDLVPIANSEDREKRSSVFVPFEELSRRANSDASRNKGFEDSVLLSFARNYLDTKLIHACLGKKTSESEIIRVDLIVVIDRDGRSETIKAKHQDAPSDCVLGLLAKSHWPKPPFSPYHAELTITL